ncbi:hypothetical protein HPB48_006527 [Haemaphysalis longicornis]|uniref:Uncharacterized protein n=1 Tax=Haemaphysalis longicornis TaxID=44386 RepID=A0A9J6G9Y9_HAELO|nr:hypothetical protein HPB48_006527 [Haemaphysalis longicornis]
MGLVRRFSRASRPPCDGFHDHVCGPGLADDALSLRLDQVVSAALLERAAGSRQRGGATVGALDKAALFYESCHSQVMSPLTDSEPHREMDRFLHEILQDHMLYLCSAGSLRTHLGVQRAVLETMLTTALAAAYFTLPPEHIAELLVFDDTLSGLFSEGVDTVFVPPEQLFQSVHPTSVQVWTKALGAFVQTANLADSLSPTAVVRVRGLRFLRKFTRFIFNGTTNLTRAAWMFSHAVLPFLEIRAARDSHEAGMAATFCYRQVQSSVYGVALDAFVWTALEASPETPTAVTSMVEQLRSQAARSASRLFDGDTLTEALQKASRDAVRRALPVPPRDGYYQHRLLPFSVLIDEYQLNEHRLFCLEDDLGGVSVRDDRTPCLFPSGVAQPLFYVGAEPFVNYPTLGFLLATAYADALYEALGKAPAHSQPAQHYAATLACLRRQVEAATNATLRADDPRPSALFRHAGALQLAHDAFLSAAGFRGGALQWRAFFARHCWLWCSGHVRMPRSSGTTLGAREACDMAVRNVLAFYGAYSCYPEDFMGNAEVCLVFGAPQDTDE